MDFTKCQSVWKAYGGSLPKNAIIYNDTLYMVKTPRTVFNRSANQDQYINQIYAEHLCCMIIHALGYDVQETILGTYGAKVAVACKDFTDDEYELEEFSHIKNAVNDCKYSGKSVDIDDILTALKHQSLIEPHILEEYFWDQFILDAFFGNVDRYNENWGILKNSCTDEVKPAPIYDCASSMDFNLSEAQIEELLASPLQMKLYVLSTHSVMTHRGKDINYASFIASHAYAGCTKALLKFMERVDFHMIHALIDSLPDVSQIRKQFYKSVLEERYHWIMEAARSHYRRRFS